MAKLRNYEDTGLTVEQLAGTAFSAFSHAMAGHGPGGQQLPPWSDLDEDVQMAWALVAKFAQDAINTLDGQPISATDLGRQCYEVYARATGRGHILVPWEQLDPRQQLAWQAAFRHLGNCLELELENPLNPTEELEAHERHWRNWTEQKLSASCADQR